MQVCFLVLQEQRLRYLKLQEQRQQQQEVSEQERLRQLRENAHNQEAKLRRVRALRGQVEQKRLSNSKLGQCGIRQVFQVKSHSCRGTSRPQHSVEVCPSVADSDWLKPGNTDLAEVCEMINRQKHFVKIWKVIIV